MTAAPTSESFWIVPGRLLAGKYPGAVDQDEAARKVAAICGAEVTAFVDLTEDGELLPYTQLLPPGVRHHRRPIADLSCAPAEQVEATLDLIDEELKRGGVYQTSPRRIGTTMPSSLVPSPSSSVPDH